MNYLSINIPRKNNKKMFFFSKFSLTNLQENSHVIWEFLVVSIDNLYLNEFNSNL